MVKFGSNTIILHQKSNILKILMSFKPILAIFGNLSVKIAKMTKIGQKPLKTI
jgi:hypothetical protein